MPAGLSHSRVGIGRDGSGISFSRQFIEHLDHRDLIESAVVFFERRGGLFGTSEPLCRFRLAPKVLEYRAVGAEKFRTPNMGFLRVELRDLEFVERLLRLAKIESCPRHRDGEIDAFFGLQVRGIGLVPGLYGFLWPPESTFTVNHERHVLVASAEAPIGAKFPQSERVITCSIRGDRERFSRYGDATGSPARRKSVLVGELRVVVDEVCNHGEVERNPLLQVGLKCLELVASGRVEISGTNAVRNLGVVVLRAHGTKLMLQTLRFGELAVLPASVAAATATRSAAAE